jgi:hypothetical protein
MEPVDPDPFDTRIGTPAPEAWPWIRETLASQGVKAPSKKERRRLSQAGLLGEPSQGHVPGVEGSTTFYPAGTAERIVAIRRIRHPSWKRMDTLRFELWWEGEEVDHAPIRSALTSEVARWCKEPATLYEQHRGDPAGFADAVDRLVRKGYRRPRAAPWRLIAFRLDFDQEDLFSFVYLVALLAAGGTVDRDSYPTARGERSRDEIFEHVLGLHRAKEVASAEEGHAHVESTDAIAIFEELQAAGVLNPTQLAGRVGDADDRELDLARDRARVLVERLGAAVAAAELLHGRDAFGLGYFATLFRERLLRRVRERVLVAFLLVAQALPEAEITELIRVVTEKASGPIALGEFVRLHPDLKPALRRLASSGPDALDEAETRRIQEEMTQFLAERPELATQFELK